MSPQLTKQQLEHGIANLEKRVQAKKLECHSLDRMRILVPQEIASLMKYPDHQPQPQQPIQEAIHNYLTAKLNQGLIDLEELELTLKAYKQMSSGVVGASMIIPPNSKMH